MSTSTTHPIDPALEEGPSPPSPPSTTDADLLSRVLHTLPGIAQAASLPVDPSSWQPIPPPPDYAPPPETEYERSRSRSPLTSVASQQLASAAENIPVESNIDIIVDAALSAPIAQMGPVPLPPNPHPPAKKVRTYRNRTVKSDPAADSEVEEAAHHLLAAAEKNGAQEQEQAPTGQPEDEMSADQKDAAIRSLIPVTNADGCPCCPGCNLKFPGKEPDRSLRRHLKYIVNCGAQHPNYEAHLQLYRQREAARATSDEKKKAAQLKYREANREKRRESTKRSAMRRRARNMGMTDREQIEATVRKWME